MREDIHSSNHIISKAKNLFALIECFHGAVCEAAGAGYELALMASTDVGSLILAEQALTSLGDVFADDIYDVSEALGRVMVLLDQRINENGNNHR